MRDNYDKPKYVQHIPTCVFQKFIELEIVQYIHFYQLRLVRIWAKCGNCDALQIEGHPSSRQSFWALITRPIMHQPTKARILQSIFRQSVSIHQCFSKKLYTVHAQKLYFPPKKMSKCQNSDTVRFGDSAFLYGTDILRSVDIYHLTLTFDPLTLNMIVSHVALQTGIMSTKFELDQPICSWPITFLLLIR